MIKQREVLISGSAGGTVNAGAVGMGFMLQPIAKPGTTELPGMFPVRVRLSGDTARELTILDSRPVFVQAGFTKLEVVETYAHNAGGHRFLASVFEVSDDWMGNGEHTGAVLRDPAHGEVPLAVMAYQTPDGINLRPAVAHTESGVPMMANDPDEHPAVLQVNEAGELRVSTPAVEPAETVFLNMECSAIPISTWWVGGGQLWPYSDTGAHDDPADALAIDVTACRQLELSVWGLLTKQNPAGVTPSAQFFLEWLNSGDYSAPVLEEIELGAGLDFANDAAAAIHLGEGIATHTSANLVTRGWRPGYVRVRVDFGPNTYGPNLRIKLVGRR